MTIDLLAKQGNEKVYTSLAGRSYDEVSFRRKELFKMVACQQEYTNRRELIANVKGVGYMNDSFAINCNITWYTMEEITSNIVWIMSYDENQDYTCLQQICKEKVSCIIGYGENTKDIKSKFNDSTILTANNILEAVTLASVVAQEQDMVLLSPSSGLEQDIEKRAEEFRVAVNNL